LGEEVAPVKRFECFKINFHIQAEHGSSSQFNFVFDVHGVSISGPNPANVSLGIGPNIGPFRKKA